MKIVSKIHQKSIKNRSKINENEARLGSKIDAKLMKNRFQINQGSFEHPGAVSGRNFGALGRILAPRGRVLGHFELQVEAQNQPKSIPRAIWNVINFLMDLKIDFWSDLVPSWPPNPSKNEAKLAPKSMQVGVLIWGMFFDGSWIVFYWILYTT